jgi:HNH endonuclease/Ribbon-helix-helix protein, copG family
MKPSIREAVFLRDGRRCAVCGFEGPYLGIDHIVPRVQGGTDEMDNLRVLCRPCNSRKSATADYVKPRRYEQRVVVVMPDELVAAIDAEAKRRDRSRSWLIRHAAENAYASVLFDSEPTKPTNGSGLHTHAFTPQRQNALRCEVCGQRQSAHPKERTQ